MNAYSAAAEGVAVGVRDHYALSRRESVMSLHFLWDSNSFLPESGWALTRYG